MDFASKFEQIPLIERHMYSDGLFRKVAAGLTAYSTISLILVGVALLCWFLAHRFYRLAGRLPPGPIGFPFLGVAPILGKHSQMTFSKWCKKYKSDIISFYVGPQLTVVLNDYELIKEAFVDQVDVFSSRPQNFIMKFLTLSKVCCFFISFVKKILSLYITCGYHGITITEGTFWRDQRRFWLRSLHDLGVGRSGFEELCIEEAQVLVNSMLAHGKNGFNPRTEIDASIANIICKLVFNKRFERRDPVLRQFLDNQHKFSRFAGMTNPVQVMPILRHVPPFVKPWNEFKVAIKQLQAFIFPEVNRIQEKYDPTHEPSCVTEAYLHTRAKEYGTGPSSAGAAEADQLLNLINITINVQISFTASTETSVTTLVWCVLFFLQNPEMQKRCYAQILERVGTERPVGWNDRMSLPYVEAFLLEVWRRTNLFPVGVVRRNTKEVTLRGFRIPKHTMIFPNLWNVHLNEKHWDDPKTFEPSRFLSEDGSILRDEQHIPFSIGKRQCAGEGVARMELFLLLANIVQKLEFIRAPEDENGRLPDENDIVSGFTVQPERAFNVCVRSR